jgi:hypothetical protein
MVANDRETQSNDFHIFVLFTGISFSHYPPPAPANIGKINASDPLSQFFYLGVGDSNSSCVSLQGVITGSNFSEDGGLPDLNWKKEWYRSIRNARHKFSLC